MMKTAVGFAIAIAIATIAIEAASLVGRAYRLFSSLAGRRCMLSLGTSFRAAS